jgi:hypothetical protein
MDTAFAIALFIAVFGPIAWMVRAQLQSLGIAQTRVRIARVRPASGERSSYRAASRAS